VKANFLGQYGVGDDGTTFSVIFPVEGFDVRIKGLCAVVREALSAGGSITITLQKKDLDGVITDLSSVTVDDSYAVGDKVLNTSTSPQIEDADEILVKVTTAGEPANGKVDLYVKFMWYI